MILPDINLLVYAHNAASSEHERARDWWESCLSGTQAIGLSWVVMIGFVRITGSRHALAQPIPPETSLRLVRSWLAFRSVEILNPGPQHLDVLESVLVNSGVTSSAATDAHLAALAIEHQAEIHSNDADFARFTGLRWRNPLKSL